MKSNLTKLALTATLAFAATLTLSACEDKEKKQTPAETPTAEQLAEATKPPEQPSGNTFTDTRDGKTYKIVKIGEQVWMAENLNIETGYSNCYDNNEDNCQKYGRLYNWETALKACPSGWHLPSNAEWDKLLHYADGTSGTENPYTSEAGGKYLKAKSGWNENGNGTDNYGFSALPGGSGDSDGGFYSVGNYGLWWSSSESNSGDAYGRRMYYNDEYTNWYYEVKSGLFSVRCVQ